MVSDIGSGINLQRKGLQKLLEMVYAKRVGEVVVCHKDRLCRYGLEFVEWLLSKTDTRLVVHGNVSVELSKSRNEELADDLLRVVTVLLRETMDCAQVRIADGGNDNV